MTDIEEPVSYPLKVIYCGECSLPLEYCSYNAEYDKCKAWLEKNLPDQFERISLSDSEKADGDADGTKKSRKRGGKAMLKAKKKVENRRIDLYRANRGKKKYVTVVIGLATFEISLKDAAKFFSSKFACGSAVTGDDEIVIQGDVKDDLFDLIPEKWPEVDEDSIEDMGDKKL